MDTSMIKLETSAPHEGDTNATAAPRTPATPAAAAAAISTPAAATPATGAGAGAGASLDTDNDGAVDASPDVRKRMLSKDFEVRVESFLSLFSLLFCVCFLSVSALVGLSAALHSCPENDAMPFLPMINMLAATIKCGWTALVCGDGWSHPRLCATSHM